MCVGGGGGGGGWGRYGRGHDLEGGRGRRSVVFVTFYFFLERLCHCIRHCSVTSFVFFLRKKAII